MTTTYEKGLDFEQVWAAIQAARELHEKEMKELREIQKETTREMKDGFRELKESSKQLDKQLGKLGNRFGEMVEYMIVPNLVAKFKELGFVFEKTHRDTVIENREHNIFTEVDAFLENGDKVMIVEIKNKPITEDVREHVRRMEKLRSLADLHNDQRQYLGAVAGVVMTDNVKEYAFKNGFYVVEPSGDSFTISEPKGDYKPKAW
jgi:hypothetical protein